MKKLILLFIFFGFLSALFAQSPNLMSYQAIIRNSSNQLIVSSPIGVRVSILQGSPTGTLVFRELHLPNPLTNSNGLIGLNIGSGVPAIGSIASINWSQGPYFVKVEVDPTGGTNYSIISTSQLLSVPYAFHAKTADVPGLPGPQGPAGNNGAPGPQGPAGPQGSFPSGSQAGEMNYWNGSAWLPVAPGLTGQNLFFCHGVPTWGGCRPLVTTTTVSSIDLTSATTGGNVTSDGGAAVTARGVAYGTAQNPTTSNSTTSNGTGTGIFTSSLTGLTASTLYYVRAYATNSVGTAYGNQVSFTTASNIPLSNGLIAWWPFNSNANDASGNGNHGVNNGAVLTTDRFNSSNSAYLLSGSSQHINLGNTLPSGNSTISFWFNPTSSTLNRNQFIISKRSSCLGGSEDFFDAAVNLSTNTFSSGWGNGGGYLNPTYSFLPNQWNQAVVIRESDSMVFYLNGVLLQKVFGIPRNNTVPIRVSGNFCQFGSPDWFDGKIDDIGIWNRALSASDVAQLYNSNSPIAISLPTITTTTVSSITTTGASSGGNVASDGGSAVTARGVAYGTAQNPTTSNSITSNGTGTGIFTSSLNGLTASTLYYVRAYATNSVGTAYGNEVNFSTSAMQSFTCGTSTVSDVDNNTYNTVQIGTQCWTQSNLKVSKYRNGDSIPEILNNNIWTQYGSAGVGARCAYNNNSVNQSTYGILYNGYSTSDPRGLCPTGWNIPSETDWNKLVKFLDPLADTACVNIAWCFQGSVAGGMMKTSSGWNAPNTGANNSSQFSALPGGIRMPYGTFDVIGASANWWTQSSHTESLAAWRNVYHNHASVHRAIFDKAHGFSIRCIKNL